MKKYLVAVPLFLFVFMGCDLEKKESAELPEVDVDVDTQPAQFPEYELLWAEADISTRMDTVTVPKAVVVMEEEVVEVPHIEVKMPGEQETTERSLVVEVEITGTDKNVTLQEVRAYQNLLYAIATLEETGKGLGNETMRIQDQVSIEAPEEISVRYVIVGEKPNRIFNEQHIYVPSMEELPERVKQAKTIYKK